MHLEACIFDASSHHDPSRTVFLQLARHWLVFFENHKIQVYGQLGSAGRNARGCWGRLLRGLEICRDEIASGVGRCGFCFGFDTPPLIRQGRRIQSLRAFRLACCGQWATGNGTEAISGRHMYLRLLGFFFSMFRK